MTIYLGIDPHAFSRQQAAQADSYLKLFLPQSNVAHAPTAAAFKRFAVILGDQTIALESIPAMCSNHFCLGFSAN